MRWLEQKRSERRRWTASAMVAILGLVLGIVGVVPAFASVADATCWVEDNGDQLVAYWDNVPDGLAVSLFAEQSDGWLDAIPTGSPDGIVGYGTKGSFGFPTWPGATGYVLQDQAGVAGSVWCSGPTTGGGGGISGETPAETPTEKPTETPTEKPTETPTEKPTETPTVEPTPTPPTTQPEPEFGVKVQVDCDSEKLVVTITNSGDGPGVVFVDIDGTETPITVAAGATEMHIVPAAGVARVVVHDGNVSLVDKTFDNATTGCQPPEPELKATTSLSCDTGLIVVDVTNTGAIAGEAVVVINGVESTIDVQPGTTETITTEIVGDGNDAVLVLVDGDVLASETLEEGCATPSPELTASVFEDCANNEVVVNVSNTGDAEGSAEVVINGTSTIVTVAPGETASVSEPLPTSGSYLLNVQAAGETLLTRQGTADCTELPPDGDLSASFEFSCTHNELRILVINQTNSPQEMTFTFNGDAETFTVPALQTIRNSVSLTEDQAYEASLVTADGQALAYARGTHDCVQVEERVTDRRTTDKTMELPRTGVNSFVLAAGGMTLLGAGFLALGASNVRRERLSETNG